MNNNRKYCLPLSLHLALFGSDEPKEIEEIRIPIRRWMDLDIPHKTKARHIRLVDPKRANSCYLLWAKGKIKEPPYLAMIESIRANGIQVPLVMEDDRVRSKYYIWDGNRRVNMALQLGMAKVPAIFVERIED